MLAGALGIRLLLWLGRTVPLPAGPDVTRALVRASVTNDADGADGFQLTFTAAKNRLGDFALVTGGRLAPMTRVVVGVLIGAVPQVLIDGVVTNHELAPDAGRGESTL